jgi:DNA-binding NarL/FixJ family response regulator
MSTKILLVEDYIIQSMGLGNLLEFWGYEMCEQVTSGEEAIIKAEQEKPDIVLMDINLDGDVNGIDAARQIMSCFGIPVIFTTSYSDDKTMEIAEAAQPAGYFVKPLDLYKLRSVIDNIMKKDSRYFKQIRKKAVCARSH